MASVPVSNKLLESEVSSAQAESTQQVQNFGRELKGGAAPGGASSASASASGEAGASSDSAASSDATASSDASAPDPGAAPQQPGGNGPMGRMTSYVSTVNASVNLATVGLAALAILVLALLSGLAVPTSGTVLYKGRDLSKTDRYAYRASEIGVIFQSFNLMPSMTVSENIAMSMKLAGAWHGRKEARETVLRVLDEVDLPDDYIDRRIGQLSGGEQQRVAIARALSYSPSVIIADEPTGNLDPESTAIIVDIFRALAENDGRTVIIVTHSAEVASACDDVFDLSLFKKRTRPRKARRARRPAAATGRA